MSEKVSSPASDKANNSNRANLKQLTVRSSDKQIVDYFKNPLDYELSPKMREHLLRLDDAYKKMKECRVESKAIDALMDEHNVPRSTARGWVTRALRFLSVDLNVGKAFHVSVILEQIEETRAAAFNRTKTIVTEDGTKHLVDDPDLRTVAQCDANKIKVIKEFYGEEETNPYQDLVIPETYVAYQPQLLGVENVPTRAQIEAKHTGVLAKIQRVHVKSKRDSL